MHHSRYAVHRPNDDHKPQTRKIRRAAQCTFRRRGRFDWEEVANTAVALHSECVHIQERQKHNFSVLPSKTHSESPPPEACLSHWRQMKAASSLPQPRAGHTGAGGRRKSLVMKVSAEGGKRGALLTSLASKGKRGRTGRRQTQGYMKRAKKDIVRPFPSAFFPFSFYGILYFSLRTYHALPPFCRQ